jgi:molybdopterin/thiamine biosynthesis adenylyltransferase
MTVGAYSHEDRYRAVILDPGRAADAATLGELRSSPGIQFIELADEQRAALRELTPTPDPGLIDEPTRMAYYPWRRAVIGILGAASHRRLRLDRNRHLITAEEQARLGRLRVGIIGLSVGHAVAHTLAAQGLCGELRLADFDELELSNLNRVPATVFDQGVNKAIVAARRIAELDPYLFVSVDTAGITPASVDGFLDGLDVVVEECDSLDTKVLVRECARRKGIPVLMATSDRGSMDVERFDLEPSRPVLHGLLGDLGTADLADLTTEDKVPHVLRILDAARLSPRIAASLLEVGKTLTTWPQLSGEVSLGAAVVAEAVRRIGLRERLPSGRVRIDAGALLDRIDDPLTHVSSAVEAVWLAAQRNGLAVQPVSPVFLYAHDGGDIHELSPAFHEELGRLQYTFRGLASTPPDESQALVLRFTRAQRTSVRSRRRALRQHLSPRG